MWGNRILDKMLKIHQINVYSIESEFEFFHKLEFDMFMFITYIIKATFLGLDPPNK